MASAEITLDRGTPVFTLDGKELGEVKEVREGYFKINKSWGRDYWLSMTELVGVDERGATLVIPEDEVNLYKVSKPGHAPSDPSATGSAAVPGPSIDRELFNR